MGLSTILLQINKKGRIQPKPTQQTTDDSPRSSLTGQRQASDRAERPVDPVVARLKEKRRLEKEKAEQEARMKKGLPPKQPKPTSKSTKTKKPGQSAPTSRKPTPATSSPVPTSQSALSKPKKKMNFNELMKKASKIDQDKLSIKFPAKNKSPEATGLKPHNPNKINRTPPQTTDVKKSLIPLRKPVVASAPARAPVKEKEQKVRTPLPVRKPSAKIQEKLNEKKKKQQQNPRGYSRNSDRYEDDDELSSFIASSDEEEEAYEEADYDRDEIWAIFNRGKKRSHYDSYDYDSADDMEATGAEILEEEYRSKRTAELEDLRELEQEKRLASLKRARLSKKK